MAAAEIYTPKQVARALGVSESSLKRWCDRGVLPTVRTAGGHRRIALTAVLDYLRASGRAIVRPEVLGLPATSGLGDRVLERAHTRLQAALIAGDAPICRQIIFDLFLAGHPLSVIGDVVISPAFAAIGTGWECGELEVYQERLACEIVGRVLHELEALVPPGPETAPLAIGGTIEGDVYDLATTLVALVLRQNGWRAISLGAGLPLATILAAVRKQQPRVCWLSLSHIADEAAFLAAYEDFYRAASPLAHVVVGGRALGPELRGKMQYAAYCDRLSHLESYIKTISAASHG